MAAARPAGGGQENSELNVYADAAVRVKDEVAFAGYGVFCPAHSIRVMEPVPGTTQTMDRAELHALLAALELIHGVRSRAAVIHLNSAAIADAYENKLSDWHANRWRTERGRAVKNRKIWKEIWDLWNVFLDRGVDVTLQVKERSSEHNMRVANRLAKHGAGLHVTCELCHKSHGRQWGNHGCEPICDFDRCKRRVFKDVQKYMKHLQRRHQRKCKRHGCDFQTFSQKGLDEHEREVHRGKVHKCPFCGEFFRSLKKVKKHVQTSCKEAPYCADCGRLFKTKKELLRHQERKMTESELSISSTTCSSATSSSSSSDEAEEELLADTTDGMVDDDIAADLARFELGRQKRLGVGGEGHTMHDLDDDESDSSSDSSSDFEYLRRRRPGHVHHRRKHKHKHKHKHHKHHHHKKHHHHHHHHHHPHRHRHRSHSHSHRSTSSHRSHSRDGSIGSQGSGRRHSYGHRAGSRQSARMAMTDGERDWNLPELGVPRLREPRWYHYGNRSE